MKIRTNNSFGVRIEKLKNSKVIQCKRCQRFSHTATQCRFQYRCVQCITQHQPGQCPRVQNSRLPLGCINCASNKLNHRGHTANDVKKCEYFKTLNLNRGKSNGTAENSSNDQQATNVTKPTAEKTVAREYTYSKKKSKQVIAKYRPSLNTAQRQPNPTVNSKSNGNTSQNVTRNANGTNNDISKLINLIRGLNKALTDFANGLN